MSSLVKGPSFFGAEEGEDSQEFLLVDTGVLHGVEDVVFAVAVDVEGGS